MVIALKIIVNGPIIFTPRACALSHVDAIPLRRGVTVAVEKILAKERFAVAVYGKILPSCASVQVSGTQVYYFIAVYCEGTLIYKYIYIFIYLYLMETRE